MLRNGESLLNDSSAIIQKAARGCEPKLAAYINNKVQVNYSTVYFTCATFKGAKMSEQNSIFSGGIFKQGFGFSPKLLMKDSSVSIEAKAIYAYLSSYAGAGMSSFPSVGLICHELGISRQRYNKHRKLLEEKGYLTVTQERVENGFSKNIYQLNTEVMLENVTLRNVTTQNVTSQNLTINSNNNNNNNVNSKSDIKPLSCKQDVDAVERSLIEYLNSLAGRNYKPVPSNIKFLKARLAEGHTPQEIADVIARKCAEWLDDPKMAQYLRPATLFNAEKFNQYVGELGQPLPQKRQVKQSPAQIDDNSTGWS